MRKSAARSRVLPALLFPLSVLAGAAWAAAKQIRALLKWLRRARRRKTRHLLEGLPAVVTAGAVALVAIGVGLQRVTLSGQYRAAASEAVEHQDWKAAKVYFERLSEMEKATDSVRFDLALSLDRLGYSDRAEAIMRGLAPDDHAGYSPAHQWLATKLLLQKETYKSPERLRAAESHLLLARQADPDSPDAQLKLAQYYVAVGRRAEAIGPLEAAAAHFPELNYDLAQLYAAAGDRSAARRANEAAADYYRQRVVQDPKNTQSQLRWASTRMNLGDFPGAVKILRDAMTLEPDGPFRKALADAYVAQAAKLASSAHANPGQQLALLRTALAYEPNCEQALVQLVHFGEEPNSKESAEAKELLRSLLSDGAVPATVHLALGTKAWRDEDLETAREHLEIAYRQDPNLGLVANNLAWLLAEQTPPDLPRALRLIDSVIEKWPNVPDYRDTRGQILARLERWNDAIKDLEFALTGRKNDPRLHQTLALVYSRLDMPEMAKRHAEIASRLGGKD